MKQEYALVIRQYLDQTAKYVENLHREKLLSEAGKDDILALLTKVSNAVKEMTAKE